MDTNKLKKRLSYIREKSFGLMDSHDSFRNRRLLHGAILDLCDIIEELNEQCEDKRKDSSSPSDSGDGEPEGGDDPDRPEWRGPRGYG